jgi:hypothetical protein
MTGCGVGSEEEKWERFGALRCIFFLIETDLWMSGSSEFKSRPVHTHVSTTIGGAEFWPEAITLAPQ